MGPNVMAVDETSTPSTPRKKVPTTKTKPKDKVPYSDKSSKVTQASPTSSIEKSEDCSERSF
jgi:hypothetical protein